MTTKTRLFAPYGLNLYQQPLSSLDVMGWNLANLPGRPVGGEALRLRAFFHYIKDFAKTF